MAANWHQQRWGDIATLEYGRGLRGYEHGKGPYRVFGTNGPIGWTSQPLCKHPTVIVGRKGAYRGIHFSNKPCFVIDTAFYLVPKANFDMRWAYYELLTHNINDMDSGSAIPSTSRDSFYQLSVNVPPLVEQSNMGYILGCLDDKIELNRETNRTLEKIGQALFKRWFVDFEFPDEKGRPYKSSGGGMVDSELGEIPKGWEVRGLGEFCDITMGQSPPGSTYNEDGTGLPFYQGIADFGFRFPGRRVYCTEPTRFADAGDVLLSVRAPVGSFNVAEERCVIGRGVAALRLKDGQNGFLYYLLRATQSGWETFEADGTVFGSVGKSGVHNFKVVIPPKSLRDSFGLLVRPSDEQILLNERQSRNLAAIRDSLLPRLMSGRIRVSDPAVKGAC